MSKEFVDVRIVDNFYQTSSFFPMPVVLVSTLAESGKTNLGPYSLCFPYIVTGGKIHAMLLMTRSDSNTALNITRTKVCSINFIPDKKKYRKKLYLLINYHPVSMPYPFFQFCPQGTLGHHFFQFIGKHH